MTYVVTFAAAPAMPVLTGEHLRRAAQVLPNPSEPVWLAHGIAADIPFAPLAEGFKPGLRAELESIFAGRSRRCRGAARRLSPQAALGGGYGFNLDRAGMYR